MKYVTRIQIKQFPKMPPSVELELEYLDDPSLSPRAMS